MEEPFRNPMPEAYERLDAVKAEADPDTAMRLAVEAAAYAAVASAECSLALRDEVESLAAKVRTLSERMN